MSYRNTKLSQADFMTWSKVIKSLLSDNLAAFEAFDGERFNQNYVADFENSLNVAYDMLDDKTIEQQQIQYTATVTELMKEAAKTYQEFKYFAEKAVGRDNAKMRELGSDEYKDVAKSVDKMVFFLLKMHNIGMNYADSLYQVGCEVGHIEKLKTLHISLLEATILQRCFKGKRRVETKTRTENYDKVYKFVRSTCRAAKLIFSDDLAVYKLFLMPIKNNNNATNAYEISVSGKTHKKVFDTPIEKDVILTIENNSDRPLSFYGSTDNYTGLIPPQSIIIGAGSKRTFLFKKICGVATEAENFLYVVNGRNKKVKFRLSLWKEL